MRLRTLFVIVAISALLVSLPFSTTALAAGDLTRSSSLIASHNSVDIDLTSSYKKANFFVSRAGAGGEYRQIGFNWGWDKLICPDGKHPGYDNDLAIVSLLLSAKAEEGPDHCKSFMTEVLGFDYAQDYDYDTDDVNSPACVMGYKKLINSNWYYYDYDAYGNKTVLHDINKEYDVFVIAVRGTKPDSKDVITDINSVADHFRPSAAHVMDLFKSFAYECTGFSLEELDDGSHSPCTLLTGHSLGGATVNHIANALAGIKYFGIRGHAYTFASPKTSYTDAHERYSDPDYSPALYNIVNKHDVVPQLPPTAFTRYGNTLSFSSTNQNVASNLQSLTGKPFLSQAGYTKTIFGSTVLTNPLDNILANHAVETYMSYLLAIQESVPLVDGHTDSCYSACVACPVDIAVYLGDTLLGRTINNEIDKSVDQAVPMYIEGESKYAVLPYGGDYRIELIGNGEGSMSYTVQKLAYDGESDEVAVVAEKKCENVPLIPGKSFVNEFGPDIEMQNSKLMVTDSEGSNIAEVREDGVEVPTGEPAYPQSKPESKPESIANAKISLSATQYTYDGSAKIPTVTVMLASRKLDYDVDYSITLANNVNAGTATVTVSGKGNYTGIAKATFKINPASIAKASVAGLKTKVYTGRAITQAPVVKLGSLELKSGTDYTEKTGNNKNVGTATVTITGKGNYAGKVKATFKINKAKNTMTAKVKFKTLKAKDLKKKKATVKKPVSVKKAKGKVAYKNVSKIKKLKKFKVNTKNGTITVPEGTKKGTYEVKVKVTAKGDANYKSGVKTVTVKIKVK